MRYLVLLLLTSPVIAEPIVLRNATLHDGTGKPGYVGNLVIDGERIVSVGKGEPPANAKIIDATGLIVCPGFIDLHTHCDPQLPTKSGRANKNYITQGCTTVITGNCGSGPYDVKAFFTKLENGGIGTNVIHLAPHNSIREHVVGNADRPPTAEEQSRMEAIVDTAMKDGAWGLATGLIYTPGIYSRTQEIIGLAKAASKHDGFYASHIRDESTGLLTAIEEALTIGKESGCRVHISHIKASGKGMWGKSANAIGLIETARLNGQAVTADQYPYIASSTSLKATIVPGKFRTGTAKEYAARFTAAESAPEIRTALEKALDGRDGGDRIRIARYAPKPAWQGKSISKIADLEKRAAVEIVMEIEAHGGAQVVNFAMSEEDVRIYMKRPWVATASDGSVQTVSETVPHPRSYGTFPRKIGRYAIEDGVISVEDAIRSATSLPAEILKISDRGILKAGAYADVIALDPKLYRDTATFDKPHQYATGVSWVFVNGKAVIAAGVHDESVLGGKVLRHGAKP